MNWKWFSGITDFQELRKAYVKLSKKFHPDLGGSTEVMKEINIEYGLLCELLKNTKQTSKAKIRIDFDFRILKFAKNAKINRIKLRPYQIKFLNEVLEKFAEGHTSICGVAPCGAGKTIMTGSLIKKFVEQGKRVIFFVHRQELIEQTSEAFTALGIEHGIISAGQRKSTTAQNGENKPANYLVHIASIQTLVRRINSIQEPDLLVCDECHHILAKSYLTILDKFSNSLLLGVTATPQRMGGVNLGDVFTAMVQAPSTKELIELGNLTRFKYYAPPTNPNLSKVRVKFGEYVNSDLSKVMGGSKIVGNIVEHYQRLANGKSAICYCVNVEHSKKVAARFNAAGIKAAHCDGETNKKVRAQIVEDFRVGKIKVQCNAELFGEGFDVPNMQAVILARPTKSLTLFTQQSLRPLRPDPKERNKVAIIIDHTHNCDRFGLPDEDRNWTLAPNENKKEVQHAPLKTCPHCYEVVGLATRTCPNCGYDFYTKEEQEEKLKESKERLYRTWRPTTPEEFLQIAKERKYKIGWVAIQALKYARTYDDCLKIAKICNYKEGWAWYKWQEIQEAG